MSLNASAKAQLIKNVQLSPADTGSPKVQIAILSARIDMLTGHLKEHPKDFHSRRGLIALVNRRKVLQRLLPEIKA